MAQQSFPADSLHEEMGSACESHASVAESGGRERPREVSALVILGTFINLGLQKTTGALPCCQPTRLLNSGERQPSVQCLQCSHEMPGFPRTDSRNRRDWIGSKVRSSRKRFSLGRKTRKPFIRTRSARSENCGCEVGLPSITPGSRFGGRRRGRWVAFQPKVHPDVCYPRNGLAVDLGGLEFPLAHRFDGLLV